MISIFHTSLSISLLPCFILTSYQFVLLWQLAPKISKQKERRKEAKKKKIEDLKSSVKVLTKVIIVGKPTTQEHINLIEETTPTTLTPIIEKGINLNGKEKGGAGVEDRSVWPRIDRGEVGAKSEDRVSANYGRRMSQRKVWEKDESTRSAETQAQE